MSYKNLLNISCTDKKELFCRVRDYLCARSGTYDYTSTGIGWTLHDSSYAVDEDNPQANDWFVIKSVGEGGKDDLYFHFKWYSTSNINVMGYLYWNNTTHAGVLKCGPTSNWRVYDTGSTHILSIYGDLNQVALLNEYDTNLFYGTIFGKLKSNIYSEDIALCSTNPASGSDVSITVDTAPADWAAGKDIYIRDNAGIEKTEIKTLVGNTITVDLTNSYTTPKLSEFVGYTCGQNYYIANVHALITNAGDTNAYLNGYSFRSALGYTMAPDLQNNQYGMFEVHLSQSAKGYGGTKRNVCEAHNTGLTTKDILEESDGTEWRYLHCQYVPYTAFREV